MKNPSPDITSDPGSPTTYPVVKMRPNKSPQRVRFGAPWIFKDELVLDRRARKLPAGSIIELTANDGERLGLCAFNPESRISARMLERDVSAIINAAWLQTRLQRAFDLRARLYDAPFYRLVHAEADGLPGLIIDRFGDVAVIQPNAAWAEVRIDEIAAALQAVTGVSTIVKNGTGRARGLEGLPEETLVLKGEITGPVPVQMNGATYMADLLGGQKTGLFLDQRDNHALTAKLCKDADVLDVFAHVGGFGLAALAGGAKSALAVDGSAPALELATQGAVASGFGDRFTTQKGDAFAVMTELAEAGRSFGTVICDPPAFAPAKPALEAGLRAYERVARMAAKLVRPGGFLILCSCSHAADLARFREACIRGIGKSGRVAQLIHTGSAGPDHPMHVHLAESGYLKALFFRLS
ncbi:MAG: class I SAM-dependent rRNA methyltransferase [Alphaproteobacteria bacterium]|nr:class I SAM-dependent rRNA methyltransferase [Alphaproteobacteria bacterium]